MNGRIKITVLDIDEDDIQFQIEIENYYCKTSLVFNGNSDEFEEFGLKLINFPKNINDIVEFKLGKDDRKWAYYMLIKAFLI